MSGEKPEKHGSTQGKTCAGGEQNLPGFADAGDIFCAVVVADNRDSCLSETVDWHHQEVLELVVDSKESDGCGRNLKKEMVDSERHQTSDRLHDDRGESDAIDVADILPVESVTAETDMNQRIFEAVKEECRDCTGDLSDDGRNGCTPDSHCRTAKQTEDHDRVENDIQDRADNQGEHRKHGISNCLKQTLTVSLKENTLTVDEVDREVLSAKFLKFRFGCHILSDYIREEDTDKREYESRCKHQKQTGCRSLTGLVNLMLPDFFREQGI